MFFRIHLLLLFFILNAVSAQDDFGPIKVDLEGYVDDRKGEIYVDKTLVKAPVKIIPKVVVKKEPTTGHTRNGRTSTEPKVTPTDSNTETTKERVAKLRSRYTRTKKKSPMMMYLGIGGVLVLVILVVVVVLVKKKKSASGRRVGSIGDGIGLADKIEANDEARKNNTPLPDLPQQGSVRAPTTLSSALAASSTSPSPSQSTTVYDMSEKMTTDTKVDERGRNPSGIIIDEDKYFGSGTEFIDEDLA
jgi:hypothetical protein